MPRVPGHLDAHGTVQSLVKSTPALLLPTCPLPFQNGDHGSKDQGDRG